MKEIIIDCGFNQDRVAILENSELVELYIEEVDNKRILGNIYKGRVANVLPGMQAAFVDIGHDKNAFLYVKDAIPKDMLLNEDVNIKDISIRDVVKSGQELIVQVVKEPLGTKGARITTHITLPGRYLVLMPFTRYVGISRRINEEEERERLKNIIEKIKPEDMGIIVRTAGEGKDEETLKDDLNYLVNTLNRVYMERNLCTAPKMIYKDLNLVHRTARDLFSPDTKRLLINDKDKYKDVLKFVDMFSPHLKNKIDYFDENYDIFEYFGIEVMIKNALKRKVWLKSGGYIIIDETEALTSIDVNTGKYVGSTNLEDTVLKTNIEAAKEIAKQLRLRNIGGIIIIDFIDMKKEEDENEVLECLKNELKKDKTKTTVLGITKLGLVEMTRKKDRDRLSSKILKDCPYCEGTGKVYSEPTVINKIEKEIKRISLHTNSEAVILEVNPSVNKYLEEREYLNEIEKKYNIKVFIHSVESIHSNDIKVRSMGKIQDIKKTYESLRIC
ncbi:Rne/Rng family ribonuclease, partial [Thermohalobacter berrensis]